MKSHIKSKIPRNRRGVSPVISSIILVAAVIAVGFAVLSWTQSTSSAYTSQYGSAVNSDIDKLRERVAFEYSFYSNSATPKTLTVYIMNFGQVGKVNVTTAYISNSSWLQPFSSPQLNFLNTTQASYLNSGQEGYFVLPLTATPLQTGSSYTVKIVTWRGSIFESTFVA